MNADGRNELELTSQLEPLLGQDPQWSPFGNRIAYVSNKSGIPQIYIISADGNNEVQLTRKSTGAVSPRWSPDGKNISYLSYHYYGLFIMNLDTNSEVQVTGNQEEEGAVSHAWAQDGKHLAFWGGAKGKYELYTTNSTGDDKVQLTYSSPHAKEISYDLLWSPK